jgi:hypothetical protein
MTFRVGYFAFAKVASYDPSISPSRFWSEITALNSVPVAAMTSSAASAVEHSTT